MNIVILLALGLGAGWVASRLLGSSRYGMLGDLVAGGVGACLGGVLVGRLALAAGTGSALIGVAIALVGAVLLIVAARALTGTSPLAQTLGFWRRPHVMALPAALRAQLLTERGLSEAEAAPLLVMQERGQYAGRTVTYFQVFDPASGGAPGADPRRLETLDAGSILHSGFIEDTGRIVLNGEATERGKRTRAWPDGVSSPAAEPAAAQPVAS